jgi:hypothetical protein
VIAAALERRIEPALPAQRFPQGGTTEVQPVDAPFVGVVEFVLGLSAKDRVTTTVAGLAATIAGIDLERSFGRQGAVVGLLLDPDPEHVGGP